METVVITGASRGIGLELTRQFLTQNYQVVSTFRGQVSFELNALDSDPNLTLIELELTDDKAIERTVHSLLGTQVDILINNAGVIGPNDQSMEHLRAEDWLNTFAVNTIAPLNVTRAFLPMLRRSGNARVITISSQMGALSRESMGMYAYRSSKAALNKVMQVLALELKEENIIVCPIHPGWVRTDMGGLNAEISVQESASGILSFAQTVTMSQSGNFYTWQGIKHEW